MDRQSKELCLAWTDNQRNCVWHGQTIKGTVFGMERRSNELCLAWIDIKGTVFGMDRRSKELCLVWTDDQRNCVWHG